MFKSIFGCVCIKGYGSCSLVFRLPHCQGSGRESALGVQGLCPTRGDIGGFRVHSKNHQVLWGPQVSHWLFLEDASRTQPCIPIGRIVALGAFSAGPVAMLAALDSDRLAVGTKSSAYGPYGQVHLFNKSALQQGAGAAPYKILLCTDLTQFYDLKFMRFSQGKGLVVSWQAFDALDGQTTFFDLVDLQNERQRQPVSTGIGNTLTRDLLVIPEMGLTVTAGEALLFFDLSVFDPDGIQGPVASVEGIFPDAVMDLGDLSLAVYSSSGGTMHIGNLSIWHKNVRRPTASAWEGTPLNLGCGMIGAVDQDDRNDVAAIRLFHTTSFSGVNHASPSKTLEPFATLNKIPCPGTAISTLSLFSFPIRPSIRPPGRPFVRPSNRPSICASSRPLARPPARPHARMLARSPAN